MDIICNEEIDLNKLEQAKEIIKNLQKELDEKIEKGFGPFLAAIYDEKNNLVAKASNTVELSNCSNNHAEMNTIKAAQEKIGTYDLSKYNLTIYITAEPCIMCLGAIMWSGIKEVYYSVPSSLVEEITGFDEGFKPDWLNEFKKRGIKVTGNIEVELGKSILKKYIQTGKNIYKPKRK